MTRRFRSFAALLALVGVLFSQLALAAYACPMETLAQAAAMAAMDGEGGCCGKSVDASNPALCHAHCQQGKQTLDKPSVSVPDPGPASSILPVASLSIAEPPDIAPGALPLLLARDTAPSLAVQLCCLRF